MNEEEIKEILDFIGKETNNLPVTDQILILAALTELADKVQPIYMKYKMREQGSSFLFKL